MELGRQRHKGNLTAYGINTTQTRINTILLPEIHTEMLAYIIK